MGRRLYTQIYVAFLAVAVLSAVVAATVAWVVAGDQWRGVPPPLRAAAAGLSAHLAQEGPSALHGRADQMGLHLTLRAADGAVVDHAGPALGAADDLSEGWGRSGHRRTMTVQLADGRWLIGALSDPWKAHRPGQHLGFIGVLLLAAAAGCYPLARRLTRRLEALRTQVRVFGEGDLTARVAVGAPDDEVAELAQAFNAAADRIEALVAAERRVLASASHELRSPLARLRMALELLADPALPSARRDELTADCVGDIEELNQLVEDLLQIGKLRAAGLAAGTAKGAATESDEPHADLTAIMRTLVNRAGATWVSPPPAVTVRGDSAALGRMVRNLLDNAFRHGGGAGAVAEVEARLSVEAHAVLLTISDRGPGVPPEEGDRIWRPFYRSDDHHEGADGGVGLGLALVREIAEAHGGTATHGARAGGGACFEVSLPVA